MVVLFQVDHSAHAQEPHSLFVEGYPGEVGYVPGETLNLHVSTSASVFSVEIFRLRGGDK